MPDAGFADHFSAHAAQYARFRPDYPPALFAWLRGIVRQHRLGRRWTLGQLLGYIGTWSAVQRYRRANGDAMLRDFEAQLEARWGDPSAARPVSWPLLVRAGRVGG